MPLLSFLATLSGAAYCALGWSGYRANPKAEVNRAFLLLSVVLAIWAFAFAFFVGAPDRVHAWPWFRVSAVGWTLAPPAIALFLLQVSGAWRGIWRKAVVAVGTLAAFALLIRTFTGESTTVDFEQNALGWCDIDDLTSPWYFLYLGYFLSLVGLAVIHVYAWGRASKEPYIRRQAFLLANTGLITLTLCLLSNMVLPALHLPVVPGIAPLLLLIWVGHIWRAMRRYRFMALTPSLAVPEILKTSPDAVLLLDENEQIVTANPSAEALFGASEAALKERTLHDLLPEATDLPPGALARHLERGPIRSMEVPWRTSDDEMQVLALSASGVAEPGLAPTGYVVIIRDITYREKREEKYRHLAMHDALTGLPNRHLLPDRTEQAMARARRYQTLLAIVMVDLDRFKEVNDTLGHSTGDQLLCHVADRLRASVRSCDTVVRMGGDEFLLLLSDLHEAMTAGIVAERVLRALAEPAQFGENKVHISGSLGIAVFPQDGTDLETLMMKADTALFTVKEAGRNAYQYFTGAMGLAVQQKREVEIALRDALSREEFQLLYQPIVDVETGRITALEALLRWNSPNFGVVPPLRFLPIAEDIGILLDIERWVLRTAALHANSLREHGFEGSVAINISARLLFHPGLVHALLSVLEETGMDPHFLELELKESAVLGDRKEATRVLADLRALGIRIAIDDFGSGYSSFNQLRTLPVDALKIDRFFVQHAADDPSSAMILAAMVAMAHSLGLQVVVEGVETAEQLKGLRALTWDATATLLCDRVQGFLFSGPVPLDQVSALLEALAKRDPH